MSSSSDIDDLTPCSPSGVQDSCPGNTVASFYNIRSDDVSARFMCVSRRLVPYDSTGSSDNNSIDGDEEVFEGPGGDDVCGGKGPSGDDILIGEVPSGDDMCGGKVPSGDDGHCGKVSGCDVCSGKGPSGDDVHGGEVPSGDDVRGGERPSGADVCSGENDERAGDADDTTGGQGRGRKRSRRPETWKKNIVKKSRLSGQEYYSHYCNKTIEKKKIGPPCDDGCFEKVGYEAVKVLFDNFYLLENFEAQTSYVIRRVTEVPVKRKRTKNPKYKSRINKSYTVHYNGKDYPVCQAGFLSMHGLTRRKVEYALALKMSATGTAQPHSSQKRTPVNKITGTPLERVHEHIQMLPVMSSHYTRAKSPHRKYLGSSGSIPQLYSAYKTWMASTYPGEMMVTERFYRSIFSEKYNIGFEPPKKDVCSTCGKLETQLSHKKEMGEDTSATEEELRVHQTRYRRAREEMKTMKVSKDPFRIVIAIDLQQTLPCPRLAVGQAYYKRKLWVYNFGIVDVKTNRAMMFVWDESVAGRGSSEIASCVLKWLDLRLGHNCTDARTMLTIFADNCAGQNKNLQMVLMALRELHRRRLARVEFSFLVSGHSYLPCDAAFGHVELEIRRRNVIQTPKEYMDAIELATNPPYTVVHMVRQDFKDINGLLSLVTKRKANAKAFSQASQLVVAPQFMEGYLVKRDYGLSDADALPVRLMPGRRKYSATEFNLAGHDLQPKYATERVLQAEKVQDLAYLVENFVTPASNRTWWAA